VELDNELTNLLQLPGVSGVSLLPTPKRGSIVV
jgi:hypothetical protein